MKELVIGKRLDKVPYIEKPLSQGGKIVYFTPEELEQKFNITYSESLFGEPKEVAPYLSDQTLINKLKTQKDLSPIDAVLGRLKNPLRSLAICNYGPEVGHGLVAIEDIPPNTVLFLYTGTIETGAPFSHGDGYAYTWLRQSESPKVITPLKIGGLARFLQHLPQNKERHINYLKQELQQALGPLLKLRAVNLDDYVNELMESYDDQELKNIEFKDPNMKKLLATGNVDIIHMVINGVPAVICRTIYGIQKGEQAGFSYGAQYWLTSGKNPRYFYNDGTLIPFSSYYDKRKPDVVATQVLISQAKNENPLKLYQQGVDEHKSGKYQDAIKSINSAVLIFREKVGEQTEECGNCYSALASCYRDIKQLDKAIEYCEKAITILHKINKINISSLIVKYEKCLKISEQPATSIYTQATELCNTKQYSVALFKLLFALKLFSETDGTKDKIAFCHSAIATCYRELNEVNKAIVHCEKAVQLRDEFYGKTHEITLKAKDKLNALNAQIDSTAKNVIVPN